MKPTRRGFIAGLLAAPVVAEAAKAGKTQAPAESAIPLTPVPDYPSYSGWVDAPDYTNQVLINGRAILNATVEFQRDVQSGAGAGMTVLFAPAPGGRMVIRSRDFRNTTIRSYLEECWRSGSKVLISVKRGRSRYEAEGWLSELDIGPSPFLSVGIILARDLHRKTSRRKRSS